MNKKNMFSLVVSSLVLAVVCIYMFSGYKLPGSLSDFSEKSAESRELNDSLLATHSDMEKVNQELVNKKAELDDVKSTADRSKEMFSKLLDSQSSNGKWDYHVPSLLIQLEKLADDQKVNVAMDYDTFKSDGDFVSESKKGLKVVTVKVDVYGLYNDVQRYIKSVEGIEFVSVEELSLKRVGDGDLAGTYIMNVYYLEN